MIDTTRLQMNNFVGMLGHGSLAILSGPVSFVPLSLNVSYFDPILKEVGQVAMGLEKLELKRESGLGQNLPK